MQRQRRQCSTECRVSSVTHILARLLLARRRALRAQTKVVNTLVHSIIHAILLSRSVRTLINASHILL